MPGLRFSLGSVSPRTAGLVVLGVLMAWFTTAYAAGESQPSFAIGKMIMELFGGLALFLYGIDKMTESLKAAAGDRLKYVLSKLTSNRYVGALTGAFVTAVIQSSSVTTVLVVGFTSAGVLSFAQSIGVIMGANIGTTITAQIVAFKVTKFALLLIAVGFAFLFLSKREGLRHNGGIIMGLGLLFFGMTVMSEAMQPLRNYAPFIEMMIRMENPLVGILIGAAFTALIQSSSATTAIVIVLAGQGFITLPAGIALAFGANIGTCITAMLAAIGKPREAQRAAVAHVIFNVIGVLLWVGFIDQLAAFVAAFSPSHNELSGTARLAAEAPRQIANAHTIFNVANTVILIWFTTLLARLIEWLVPDRPLSEETVISARYLDDKLVSTPVLALDMARLEVAHMGERVQDMLARIMPAILHGNANLLDEIRDQDENVDRLHGELVVYLGQISREKLTRKETAELMQLMSAVNDLENIGDVIERNLVELGHRRIAERVSVSSPTQFVLGDFHHVVSDAVTAAIKAVAENDELAAKSVTRIKKDVTRIANSAALHEAQRLVANEPQRVEAYTIEMDIAEKLQRIYYFARRMARTVSAEAPDPELLPGNDSAPSTERRRVPPAS